MKLKCFRCHKEILKGSHYYEFHELNQDVLVNIDYCHKECWDKFLASIGNTKEVLGMAGGMLKGMKSKMQEMGILQPDVVEIQ